MTLETTVITGWPERREQVPIPTRECWLYQDEISLHNGVLFRNHRIIVPKLLQAEILSRIHSSHLGAESCLRKARDVVFWPGMSIEIKRKCCQLSDMCRFPSVQSSTATTNTQDPRQTLEQSSS